MKSKKIKYLFLLSLSVVLLAGCEEYNALNLNVNSVETLYAPADGFSCNLDPKGEKVDFLWSTATASDDGYVLYEVVFDKRDGDFSNPVYRVTSENEGMNITVGITHKQLNRAAAEAGAKANETITLKWGVIASKGDGVNRVITSRNITVKRLNGFAIPPRKLYMAGDGIESKLEFMPLEEGEFETFTYIEAEKDFFFADGLNDNSKKYSINSADALVENGTIKVAQTGIYKISLDFNSASAESKLLSKLVLYFGPRQEDMGNLEYSGNGVWKGESIPVMFAGTDERYKFRFDFNDGTQEWYGSTRVDNQQPNPTTSIDYYKLIQVYTPFWYENTYKFMSVHNNKKIDVKVYTKAPMCYHSIALSKEQDDEEVEEPTIPGQLYMSGLGAEANSQFKKLLPGVFEIYTMLQADSDFSFEDANGNKYSNSNSDLIEDGAGQVSVASPYRIHVDFNVKTVTITRIEKVELFYYMIAGPMFSFTYKAKGVWEAINVKVNLDNDHGRFDERYNFRFTFEGGVEEYFASSKDNNDPPVYGVTPANYFYLFPYDYGDEHWKFANNYKFGADIDKKYIDMTVTMSGSDYTHEFTRFY